MSVRAAVLMMTVSLCTIVRKYNISSSLKSKLSLLAAG